MLRIRQTPLLLTIALSLATAASAQDNIDRPPINYSTAPLTDAATKLQAKIDAGETKLTWDQRHGWLPALLKAFNVPVETQLLVFSKTSLQVHRIAPETPRALYFNDEVYVGWVPGGDIVEISTVDPHLGPVFYSLEQTKVPRPQIVRDTGQCLACHLTDRTRDVPGYLVRSVFPDQRGHPLTQLGSTTTNPTTPLAKRFGGWYLTGSHGKMSHRGNRQFDEEGEPVTHAGHLATASRFANRQSLDGLVSTKRYLTPHSDLVALMVLEHQSQMHNAITRAGYEARSAAHYDKTWNEILGKPAGHQHGVSKRRIQRAVEELLQTLLFSGEYPLESPVQGTSQFAQQFVQAAQRDRQGRSLRDLDLQTRLLKYPCSYLIYSESFRSLPRAILNPLGQRLAEVLDGSDRSDEYSHLSRADRQAIRQIIIATLPVHLLLQP